MNLLFSFAFPSIFTLSPAFGLLGSLPLLCPFRGPLPGPPLTSSSSIDSKLFIKTLVIFASVFTGFPVNATFSKLILSNILTIVPFFSCITDLTGTYAIEKASKKPSSMLPLTSLNRLECLFNIALTLIPFLSIRKSSVLATGIFVLLISRSKLLFPLKLSCSTSNFIVLLFICSAMSNKHAFVTMSFTWSKSEVEIYPSTKKFSPSVFNSILSEVNIKLGCSISLLILFCI